MTLTRKQQAGARFNNVSNFIYEKNRPAPENYVDRWRLAIIANSGLRAGKTMWIFDQTDMAEAKKKFGSWVCIGGNMPSSLFKVATAEQMETYVKKLIEACAPGAVLDEAKAENIHTYLRVARECGSY